MPFSGRRNSPATSDGAGEKDLATVAESVNTSSAVESQQQQRQQQTTVVSTVRRSLRQRTRQLFLRPWYSFRALVAEAFVWVMLPLMSSFATVSLLSAGITSTGLTAVLALLTAPLPIFLCMSLWMTLGRSLISDRMDFVDRCPRCERDTVHGVVPWPLYMSTPLRRFRCRECGLYTRETVAVMHSLAAAQSAGYVRPGRDGWASTYIHQYPDSWILEGRTDADPDQRIWIRRFAVLDNDQSHSTTRRRSSYARYRS